MPMLVVRRIVLDTQSSDYLSLAVLSLRRVSVLVL
jgi:hypothetical protein